MDDAIPIAKKGKGAPKKRRVAKLMAARIVDRTYRSLDEAARAGYSLHFKRTVIKEDNLRDLKKYIVEELECGPKPPHVLQILEVRLLKQRQQRTAKNSAVNKSRF